MIEWSPVSYHNLTELLRLQSERLGPQPALRYRRYGLFHDVSWERYRQEALACGAGLVDAGIRPGDRVGILAENRLEWLIADMGILAAAAVNVPPHAPLTARQVLFQLQDAGVRWGRDGPWGGWRSSVHFRFAVRVLAVELSGCYS